MSNYTYRSRCAPFFDTFLFGFPTMPPIAPLTNPRSGGKSLFGKTLHLRGTGSSNFSSSASKIGAPSGRETFPWKRLAL